MKCKHNSLLSPSYMTRLHLLHHSIFTPIPRTFDHAHARATFSAALDFQKLGPRLGGQ